MKKITDATVLTNTPLAPPDVFDLRLSAPGLFENGVPEPGQFVMLATGRADMPLARPISVCDADAQTSVLRLVYRVAGKGTAVFSAWQPGDTVWVNGPLGRGFAFSKQTGHHIFVGGGVGVPPLLFAAKKAVAFGKCSAVLGFRDRLFLAKDFAISGAETFIATETGRVGFKGHAAARLEKLLGDAGLSDAAVYACGPLPMLKAVCALAQAYGLPAQVSVEERMACGIGACVGCAVRIRQGDGFVYKRVCADGPVFDGQTVDFS